MTDKKVSPPKPKTKTLTKSQEKLLNKSKNEIELLTREIFSYIAERINRLGTQVVENLLETFVTELEIDKSWVFDPRTNKFRKDN